MGDTRLFFPLGLGQDHGLGTFEVGGANPLEYAVLPLAYREDTAQLVVFKLDGTENGFKGTVLELFLDSGAINLANTFDGLLQHLQTGIRDLAASVVGVFTRHFLMTRAVGHDGF